MAAKKKPAKKKSRRVKQPAKKGSKKPAKAVKRPAKPARKPVKPGKPVKKAARKAPAAKAASLAKKPAMEKKGALRAVATSSKAAPALKIVAATKAKATATGRSAVARFQTPAPAVPKDKPRAPAFNRDYMNPRQIEVFRKLLLDWKRSLMEEVDRTVHHMQDEASNFPDPNDRATQEEEFALELRTRDRERKLIKKIDEALSSLDGGDYGYCEICGVEIGIKRLEARPTATLCIDCKNLEEIKERQYG